MRLAGTYHPIAYTIERLQTYFPSITVVNALWKGFDKNLRIWEDGDEILEGHLKIEAQNLRNVKSVAIWADNNSIFPISHSTRQQLSLDEEDALNVLKLYFPSPVDGLKDILCITFPDHFFLKNPNVTFRKVSTQEKNIIEKLLVATLMADYTKAVEEQKLLSQFQKVNQKNLQKIQRLSEENKTTQKLYSNAIHSIIQEFKAKMEIKLQRTIQFSDAIVFKLAKERFTLQEIYKVLEDAIYLAFNFSSASEVLEINEDFLLLNDIPILARKESKKSDVLKDKIFILLDRYEAAAQLLADTNQNINGKNIAAKLDPPITPPAISDAVKKNKIKIANMLKHYPERWKLTRTSIRPIALLDADNKADSFAS